jgi:hypothetical protein
MRVRRGTLMALLFVAMLAAAPTGASGSSRTYAHFGAGNKYRPKKLFFGAHSEIVDITWSKWRKEIAKGQGTFLVNDCIPDCADGTITPTPGGITLTGRKQCGKRFVFRFLKIFFEEEGQINRITAPAAC